MWIRSEFGELGDKTLIKGSCLIQGNGRKIIIGSNTCLQGHNVLGCWRNDQQELKDPLISIGDNCNIGEYTHISAYNKIIIGNGLLTGRFVIINDNSHGGLSTEEGGIPPHKRQLSSKGEIVIGKNVWLGEKVAVLSGVHIGDNVIVGANSVVTHDIPSNCVAVGSPAKIVKKLL